MGLSRALVFWMSLRAEGFRNFWAIGSLMSLGGSCVKGDRPTNPGHAPYPQM